jgi:hypothetical protein
MSQVQLEAFFLVQNACTAFPSTLVSMLELSAPLPISLLLRVAGLSGLNTIIVPPHKPEGTLRVGRPAIRWQDSAEDQKTMDVRNWRRKSQDRGQRRAIVKEAEVHLGHQRPQKKKKKKKKKTKKKKEKEKKKKKIACVCQ